MIRHATEADVPRIVEMGQRFVASTAYATLISLNTEQLTGTTRDLLNNPDALVLLAEKDGDVIGMLAAIRFNHPMSGQHIAQEVVWWVDPEHRGTAGIRLLRAAEAWAVAGGAEVLQMIAPSEKVGKFYAAVGYAPVETVFQRRLS